MSVGVLLMTHEAVGHALISATHHVMPKLPLRVMAVEIPPQADPDVMRTLTARHARELDEGDGVLVLADLYGGRTVFTVLMLVSAVPPLWASVAASYNMLLAAAFCLGLAGSSFAVGVGFVSRWYPPRKQGTALGVYGLGNIGQSVVVF